MLLVTLFVSAQKKDLQARIVEAAEKIEPQTVAWRRDIHEHPELGNREFRTAKLIADYLRSLGLEVKEGVGKTGVVGILRGAKPGPVIGLRADMDGLPLVGKNAGAFRFESKDDVQRAGGRSDACLRT